MAVSPSFRQLIGHEVLSGLCISSVKYRRLSVNVNTRIYNFPVKL